MEKKERLKKHKAMALFCLVGMMILYVGCIILRKNGIVFKGIGVLEAFAEAGMVGGFADWFAVVALFKHPLGIPLAHTNIIENNKNSMGEGLGKFVNDNFLTQEKIRPYVEKLSVSEFVQAYLCAEKNKKMIVEKICQVASKIVKDIDKEKLSQRLSEKMMPEILNLVEENKRTIENKIEESLPLMLSMFSSVASKLVIDFLKENLEKQSTREKAKIFIEKNMNKFAGDIQDNLNDSTSDVYQYIEKIVEKYIENFKQNKELKDKIDVYCRYRLYKVVLENKQEVGKIISGTVRDWNTDQLSNKLEEEVGSDLQFIRLNGTFVGGFVGVLIYVITQMIGL